MLRLCFELVRCIDSTCVFGSSKHIITPIQLFSIPHLGRNMDHVGAAPKRCVVDDRDRREVGRLAKKQRTNTTESKELLAKDFATQVLAAADQSAIWGKEVSLTRSARSKFFEVLSDLRFHSISVLDQHGLILDATLQALSTTREVEEHMPEMKRLEKQILGLTDLEDNWHMLDMLAIAPAESLSIAQKSHLIRKVAYYRGCLETPIELQNLEKAPRRHALLEYDNGEDDVVERDFVELFNKAKGAVQKAEDVTKGLPLTELELAQYAGIVREDLNEMHDTVTLLLDNLTVYKDVTNGIYKPHIPTIKCVVCYKRCVDASECDYCLADGICATCFSERLFSIEQDGWQDLRAVRQVANFECLVCNTGHYDIRLGHLLREDAAKLHRRAVVQTCNAAAHAIAEQEADAEKTRRFASYKGLSYHDKLYMMERDIIGDTVATKCPSCHKLFYNFDGCCALTCSCGAHFCALCFKTEDKWEVAGVHEHVMNCGDKVPGFHELFMSTDAWMTHIKRRQYDLCKSYLSGTDLPKLLKDRLQADFPHP